MTPVSSFALSTERRNPHGPDFSSRLVQAAVGTAPGATQGKAKAGPRPTARPAVECLEDRTLLTGGTWTPLTNLAPDTSGIQTMMLLSDGTIMAQGGSDSASKNWYSLTPDSSGSYVNGAWSLRASMNLERLFFPSNVLPDGRVFVYGGEYSGPNTTGNIVNNGEIYDPTTNSWTPVTPIPLSLDPGNVFGDDPTEVIAGGKVLAGYIFDGRTFVYDPTSNSWSAGPTKLNGDQSDEEAWVKLPDGSILSYDIFDSQHSQRFEPSTNTWVDSGTVPVPLETSAAELGPGFLLPDGRVFYIGGNSNTALYTPPATPSGTGSWVAGPTIPGGLGGNDAPGAVEPNGDVLFAAGTTPNFSSGTALFEYDPVANTITPVSTPTALTNDLNFTNGQVAFNTRMVELPTGQILFSDASDQLWVYTPNGAPQSAWQPTVTGVARNAAAASPLPGPSSLACPKAPPTATTPRWPATTPSSRSPTATATSPTAARPTGAASACRPETRRSPPTSPCPPATGRAPTCSTSPPTASRRTACCSSTWGTASTT